MDRKQWLTMLYREANLFLEHHDQPGAALTPEDLEELEPELDAQLREVLRTCDSLEDLIKHSVLKEPAPELWREQEEWGGVLVSVASACLRHDVKGILLKILAGELPRAPSGNIQDPT
jgi:hypothetical protein